MDTGKLLTFGVIGVAAYYVYTTYFAGPPSSWTAAGGTAAQWSALSAAQQAQWNTQAAAPAAATVAASTVTAAAAPAKPATMDALFSRISALSANDPNLVSGQMSGDHWNYYANQVMGATFSPAWRSGPITLSQYWQDQAPVIKAATGLGGFGPGGLGFFGGLGDIVAAY